MNSAEYYKRIEQVASGTVIGLSVEYLLSVHKWHEYHILLFGELRRESGVITGIEAEGHAIATIYFSDVNGIAIPYCADRGTRTAGPEQSIVHTRFREKGVERVHSLEIGVEEIEARLIEQGIKQFLYIPRAFSKIR